jgi:hypothetical protein
VIIPRYIYEDELNIWRQVDIPPTSLYKTVGFNDLKRVRIIMEGNDEEKRNAKFSLEDLEPQVRNDRKEKLTNLHYRRFFDQELEKNKDLFPENPFTRIPVMRG